MKDKLKARQDEAKGKFEQLEKQREAAANQRAELDRQIAAIVKEQVLLQGEFRALNDLLNGDDKDEPKLEIPKKKKK